MDQAERAKQERRIERWELRVTLWLGRVFTYLSQFTGAEMPQAWRQWFDSILKILAKAVLAIVLLKTALRLKPGAKPKRRFYKRPPPFVSVRRRAMFGAQLRRALKGRTLMKRLSNILRALEQREKHVAKFIKRLLRTFTRLYSAHTRLKLTLDDLRGEAFDAVMKLMRGSSAEGLRVLDTS